MTVLTLNKTWINRLDTGEGIAFATGRDRTQQFSMDLNVRTYASGRRRAISTVGEAGEVSFRALAVNLTMIEKLRSWAGVNVQVRDHQGQKWFGVFAGIAVTEYMPVNLYAATITLLTTTTVEGV
jgi:hypothetical protein